LHAVKGEKVSKGQKLFTLHTETPERFERSLETLQQGFKITDAPLDKERQIILDRIG